MGFKYGGAAPLGLPQEQTLLTPALISTLLFISDSNLNQP